VVVAVALRAIDALHPNHPVLRIVAHAHQSKKWLIWHKQYLRLIVLVAKNDLIALLFYPQVAVKSL
jgi:hypothetical protein